MNCLLGMSLKQGSTTMRLKTTLAAVVLGLVASTASAQIIFTETFDNAGSSANFATTSVSLNNDGADPADVYSEFGFDYSATGSSRLTASIGTAPNGGSSTGLILAANVGGSNRSSINLFPIISGAGLPTDPTTGLPVIDSNYKMTFDFWGGINNSSGTTEFLQMGAQSNGDGTHLNGFGEVISAVLPDSDFFEINIAGDLSTSDYIPFSTFGGIPSNLGFIPNTDPEPVAAFPNPPYTAQAAGGAPGEAWAEAEIRHEDGITTLAFNGVDITTIEFSDFANDLGTAGLPWFGYTDFYNSQAGGDSTKVAEPGGGPLVGDYNGDNTVDAADYTVYRDTLGNSVTPGTGADGNNNGAIDPGDLTEWANNYNNSGPVVGSSFDPFNASFVIIDNVVVELLPTAASSATAVPEPTSMILLALGLMGVAARNRS